MLLQAGLLLALQVGSCSQRTPTRCVRSQWPYTHPAQCSRLACMAFVATITTIATHRYPLVGNAGQPQALIHALIQHQTYQPDPPTSSAPSVPASCTVQLVTSLSSA
jgi:hypothetical protein